jgi:hypothetical protein
MSSASFKISDYTRSIENLLKSKVNIIVMEEAKRASELVNQRVLNLATEVGIDLLSTYDVVKDANEISIIVKPVNVKS